MTITNIGTDKSYEMVGPYGLKIWDKKSVSGTVTPGEDIQQAYKELDKVLEVAHQATLSEMEEMRGTKVVDVVEPQDKIQAFKETLDMCTNLTMLLRFKAQVGRIGDEGLTQFYETKLQSLKNK